MPPRVPRSWAYWTVLLIVTLLAAVPPYLMMVHFEGVPGTRLVATLFAFVPGLVAITLLARLR